MSTRCKEICAATLMLCLTASAATTINAQGAQTAPKPEPTDSLGRNTPRGTISGFNLAVHRGDFVSAARYMQVPAAERENAEQLARDLTELIDRFYQEPIAALSGSPEGTLNDGLGPDRERVVLRIGSKPVDLVLVRVKDPEAGQIWLISSQALSLIPVLRESAEDTWLERLMPRGLVDTTMAGIPVARWLALAASLVIPFAALSLLSTVGIWMARRVITDPPHRRLLDAWYAGLRRIVILVLTLAIHLVLLPLLGFSLRFRLVYRRVALVVAVVACTWLMWRFMTLSFADARLIAQRHGQSGITSLLMLAERVCKTVVVLVAAFALLTLAGVDTTTALAGVGIGGVAVALGAQKSVENLLGGVFLITDRALAVGDTCSIANRVGVVEDITMRSVRLRTTEQTLLSVPAGLLSQSSLENFATRDKILIQTMLRLRYGTTASQMQRVLSGVRALLDAHPDIEKPTARVRLVDFSVRAIEIEVFAYVLTRDPLRFQAVREELLLRVATLIEASGTGFYQEPPPQPAAAGRAADGVT